MRSRLYLRKGHVFIPTTGLVHKGLYRDIEPVAAVAICDADAVHRAFRAAIARGNPPTPYYRRGVYPRPVVVKYAGVKTWSEFERGTSTWSIDENGGDYQIIGYRMSRDGWVEDPMQKIEFPPGTSLDAVIDRMIAILQDVAKRSPDG